MSSSGRSSTRFVYNHFVEVGTHPNGAPIFAPVGSAPTAGHAAGQIYSVEDAVRQRRDSGAYLNAGASPSQAMMGGGGGIAGRGSIALSTISSIAPRQSTRLSTAILEKRAREDYDVLNISAASEAAAAALAVKKTLLPHLDPFDAACRGEVLEATLPAEAQQNNGSRKSRRAEIGTPSVGTSGGLELESVRKFVATVEQENDALRRDIEDLDRVVVEQRSKSDSLLLLVTELKEKLTTAEGRIAGQARTLDELREMKGLVQSFVQEVRQVKSQVDTNEGRLSAVLHSGSAATVVAPSAAISSAPPSAVKFGGMSSSTASSAATTPAPSDKSKPAAAFGGFGTPVDQTSASDASSTAAVAPPAQPRVKVVGFKLDGAGDDNSGAKPPPPAAFGFGTAPATAMTGAAPSPFGAPSTAATTTGAAPSPFGAPSAASAPAPPKSDSGASTSSISPFGAPPAATQAAPNPFGAPLAADANKSASSAAPFGFGATPPAAATATTAVSTAPPAAAPTPSFGFGGAAAVPAATTAPPANPFGTAAPPAASTAAPSPFGNAASTNPSTFGAAPTAPSATPFGASAPASASAPSPFGATAPPTASVAPAAPASSPFGATSGGTSSAPPAAVGSNPFAFGGGGGATTAAPAPAGGNPFSMGASGPFGGAPSKPPTASSPFGGGAAPPTQPQSAPFGFGGGAPAGGGAAGPSAAFGSAFGAQPMMGAPPQFGGALGGGGGDQGGGSLGAHKKKPQARRY